jgi:hypothetical protein
MWNIEKFAVVLKESDLKFLDMTDEENEQRAARLDYKCLIGIIDEETIEEDEWHFRRTELRFGTAYAEKNREIEKMIYGE